MNKKIKMFSLTSLVFLVEAITSHASLASIKVITTTSDLAAIVSSVGGNEVNVQSIVKGTQDAHTIEAKPSFMVKMRDADLVVAQGLELEDAWLNPLLAGARNTKIHKNEKGFLELGEKLNPLEVMHGEVSRSEGDVHPSGNPHFQLDPVRLAKSAILIADKLSELDPKNTAEYQANAKKFETNMLEKFESWKKRMSATGVTEFVSFHKNFSYFCNAFNLKCSLQLEPKPGIPPTASHLLNVISEIKSRNIKLVLIENYFDDSVSGKIKQSAPNVKVVRVPISVLGEPEVKTNFDLIENLVKTFESAK